jgi:hypothetical protein
MYLLSLVSFVVLGGFAPSPGPQPPPRVVDAHDLIIVGQRGSIRLAMQRSGTTDTLFWSLSSRDASVRLTGFTVLTGTGRQDTAVITAAVPSYGLYLLAASAQGDTATLRTTVAFVPRAVPDARFGLHLASVDWIPPIGAGSLRLFDSHTDWAMIAPSRGTFNWARLDSLVAQAETHGLRLLLTLANTPRWASREPDRPAPPHPSWLGSTVLPRDMKDWTFFVDTVTRRYANRLDAIEVWNEPNYSFFSDGPGAYGMLLKATTAAVRQSGSRVKVAAPAVSGKDFFAFVDTIARMAGPVSFDAFSMHVYPSHSEGPESWLPVLHRTDSLLAHLGWPRTIWVTEAGYWIAPRRNGWPMSAAAIDSAAPPGTRPNWVTHWPYRPAAEDSAAAFIVREHALLFGEGIPRVYWYHWTFKDFGLTDTTGAPKAPVVAYAALTARIGGLTQHTRLADGPFIYAYRFSNGTSSVIVAWSTASGGSDWTVPPAGGYLEYDMWGNSASALVAPSQPVHLGPMPIYLEPR